MAASIDRPLGVADRQRADYCHYFAELLAECSTGSSIPDRAPCAALPAFATHVSRKLLELGALLAFATNVSKKNVWNVQPRQHLQHMCSENCWNWEPCAGAGVGYSPKCAQGPCSKCQPRTWVRWACLGTWHLAAVGPRAPGPSPSCNSTRIKIWGARPKAAAPVFVRLSFVRYERGLARYASAALLANAISISLQQLHVRCRTCRTHCCSRCAA